MNEDPSALLPEIFLAVAAVVAVLLGSYLPRQRQWPVRLVTALACLAGLVAAVVAWGQDETVFGGSYAIDVATNAGRAIVLAAVLITLGVSAGEFRGAPRESELYVLMLLAALGTVLLTGANDLMLLVAAYLLASIPLYALAGFAKDDTGTEASLKFYLLGALLGIVMLSGATVLFGVGGASGYAPLRESLGGAPVAAVAVGFVGVLGGLLFKVGAVPAHFWVPDVTEGTRPPVAAFLTTVPKIGGVIAAYRLVSSALAVSPVDWALLLAIVAAVTMTLGNLAAFFQQNVRRLLAYSTISQVGYLLMAVAVALRSDLALPSLLLYVAAYAVTNLGAFAVVCALPKTAVIEDYSGLVRHRPGLAIALAVCLLGLVGTPPTGVFVGKLTVFTAAFDGGFAWLVVVAAVNTVASLFYYVRWIAPAARATDVPAAAVVDRWSAGTAYAAATTSVALGPLAGLLLATFGGGLVLM
ncbi:NADH-quinone oxidoreductase subunit N [Amycolatopsis thermophila]|uniref:NADH-quinone oxidoreductase subunit N n=1 Tax=Amycolatopsis thermophila TaxID=206084 RepID=A0ABU0F374_9PSEU|nr:NADH-quinone oxidoreductase subunit N [Amycolatopsis thermophila]MDQ0382002.1 NADH-quinone oxidoreductase subunit N [Amycolatopsis thermophila]